MDATRIIAVIVFIFSGYMLLDAWDKEHAPQAHLATTTDVVPQKAASAAVTPVPAAGVSGAPSAEVVTKQGQKITVTTDVFVAEIDANGGDLRRLTLLKHLSADDGKDPLTLMQDSGQPVYVAQSGLIGAGLPNHTTVFTTDQTALVMGEKDNTIELELKGGTASGLDVRKVFVFHRNSYIIDTRWDVKNVGTGPVSVDAYFQFLRNSVAPPGDPRFVSTFTGPAFYTASSLFEKVQFSDVEKGKAKVPGVSTDGWVAMLQHYFVAAYLPQAGLRREFYVRKVADDRYTAGVIVSGGALQPGESKALTVPLYAGPQVGEDLKALAPGLDLTIDYGWLALLAVPIWHTLEFIHHWVGNWGWAIVLLTVLIKLLFYPLSAASYRSMAKMRLVAPKLQQLKEQYGDDAAKRNQAMMELYKTEKINPLGGCLPIVIQIPVFIALYWTLLASVELRHAPFLGWIHDLSAQDPLYILPIIMGITSFVQTKMQPPPPDPVQAKVMMIMPLMFSVMFFFFPAGLVLYWVVNNTLSILQQWMITRSVEQG
jgi:YidC/Oxa1 family membrane protein insertase